MPTVEVFITIVSNTGQSQALLQRLLIMFPYCRINFDLEDHDRVLRVEGENFAAINVILLMKEQGFVCQELAQAKIVLAICGLNYFRSKIIALLLMSEHGVSREDTASQRFYFPWLEKRRFQRRCF